MGKPCDRQNLPPAGEMEGLAFMTFLVKKQTWGHRSFSGEGGRGQQIFSRHLPTTRRTDVPRKTACANTPVSSSSSSLPIVVSFARSVVRNEIEPTYVRTMKRPFSCILQFDHVYGVLRPPRSRSPPNRKILACPVAFRREGLHKS